MLLKTLDVMSCQLVHIYRHFEGLQSCYLFGHVIQTVLESEDERHSNPSKLCTSWHIVTLQKTQILMLGLIKILEFTVSWDYGF